MPQSSKILTFYKKHKRMPSYAEIATLFGFRSKNAAYKLVGKLIQEGILGKDRGRLVPRKLFGEIKVLGVVEAGFPGTAEEETLDSLSLDDFLIDDKDSTYMLRVKGDSMINAGIREGDLVLVERGRSAREGDIVIAEVDSEWTMKYLRRKAGRSYLEPANEKYPLIFPKGELKIAAVVRAVIRKY
jgi:SOS regulatory protein LexA